MTHGQRSYLVDDAVPGERAGVDLDRPVTDATAARLRDLARRTGEPVDANLTEGQALRRIAALEELHDLDR